MKEKYVDNEVLGKTNKDASDSSDFVKIESDSFEYDPNNGNVSMSSSYSFNSQKNYFMKKPKKLGINEDPLSNRGLD